MLVKERSFVARLITMAVVHPGLTEVQGELMTMKGEGAVADECEVQVAYRTKVLSYIVIDTSQDKSSGRHNSIIYVVLSAPPSVVPGRPSLQHIPAESSPRAFA